MLPSRAIRFGETGEAYVYAVDQDETVSVIEVTTGWDNGNSIEILSGVEPGRRAVGFRKEQDLALALRSADTPYGFSGGLCPPPLACNSTGPPANCPSAPLL